MKTIVALFDNLEAAHAAVADLRNMGLTNNDVSLVAHDVAGTYGNSLSGGKEQTQTKSADATAAGAGMGAVLGGLTGLLVGLGALMIPGIGPVLAAGPLATALAALVGAGVGAVGGGLAGGLIGALVDLGVPEDEAQNYAEGVRRGGALVTARVDDQQETQVRGLFSRHQAVDVNQRAEAWRSNGWTGYNPKAEPYTREQVDAERSAYTARAGMSPNTRMDQAFNNGDESYYREHYAGAYGATGRDYDAYRPAYQYGQTLRNDARYTGWDWDRVEPEARRDWERQYPNNTWADFKSAVRTAWENVKAAVH